MTASRGLADAAARAQPLQKINRDERSVGALGRDARDLRPMLGGNTVARPVADGAAARPNLGGQLGRPTQGTDDRVRVHTQWLPEMLAQHKNFVARPSGKACARFPGKFADMPAKPKKPPSKMKVAVARRLQAIQDELGQTDEAMGAMSGKSRQAWSNWSTVNQSEMPPVEAMARLCDELARWNLTLDWIYRGVTDHLHTKIGIRLSMRERGHNPDEVAEPALEPSAPLSR